MKIGFLTSIQGWGGSELYLRSLMRGIRRRGHEVILFGVEGVRLTSEMRAENVEVVCWAHAAPPSASPGAQPVSNEAKKRFSLRRLVPLSVKLLAGNAAEIRRLSGLLSQRPVDVLHVNVHGYETAGVACRLRRIPSVGVYHIVPVEEALPVRRWLIRHTAVYDRLCMVSRACRDAWQRVLPVAPAKCRAVSNGIDLSRFADRPPRVLRRTEDPLRVISVGRLHPMKGYRYLIEAMALLGDPRIKVEILGDGEERAELVSLAGRCGVADRIRWAGHCDDVVSAMRDADVFVLPSVSHEGSSLVCMEAMAAGLPLITSDFGPLPEVNVQGETGLVVPARDARALAAALRRLADDPILANTLGANGARCCRERFSEERVVDQMLAVYTEIARH